MGTRAKVRLETKDEHVCSTYFHMDGHVKNWAPELISALSRTTPDNILKNRQLLKFMSNDYERDEWMDYLCIVDISDEHYKITIYGYGKKMLFEGSLDEFAEKYDQIH